MVVVTTVRILAEKALQRQCGQECIDWAIGLLEKGRDGDNVERLAGMLPPFNHFQLAALRDQTLREQGKQDVDVSIAIREFAAEHLSRALSGDLDLIEAIDAVKNLCVTHDYDKSLHDFYLLYWAYSDLSDGPCQWYWPDATRDNIDSLIRQTAERFLRENDSGDFPTESE